MFKSLLNTDALQAGNRWNASVGKTMRHLAGKKRLAKVVTMPFQATKFLQHRPFTVVLYASGHDIERQAVGKDNDRTGRVSGNG